MSLSSVMEHLNMQLPACIQTGARTKFAFAADELIWSPLPPSDQGRALIHSFIHSFIHLLVHNELAVKVPGTLGLHSGDSNCRWTV